MDPPRPDRPPVFAFQSVSFRFPGAPPHVRPTVCDVTFSLAPREAVALVGESGSGKSTIGRLAVGLIDAEHGQITLEGKERRALGPQWRRRVQLVFQDPFASLNPAHTVRHHLVRPLVRGGRASGADELDRVGRELLDRVGLRPAEEFLDAYPQELSGGQRQRVAIARALAPGPDVLVADEPTSMLDVSLRAGVLQILHGLVQEAGLALLLVTHDLASARLVADRVLVLYAGEIVEEGPCDAVLGDPAHPYTRLLVGSVPGQTRIAGQATRKADSGTAPVPPGGCAFEPRCPVARASCRDEAPPLVRLGTTRAVRCHLMRASQDVRSEPE